MRASVAEPGERLDAAPLAGCDEASQHPAVLPTLSLPKNVQLPRGQVTRMVAHFRSILFVRPSRPPHNSSQVIALPDDLRKTRKVLALNLRLIDLALR